MRVTLILTHQCNLACTYCYAGTKFNRGMTLDTGIKALKLAFEGPLEETVGVSFFGGEPMLEFPMMARLTRTASRWAERLGRQVEFSLTTNATILTEQHLNFFHHYGFWVALSIDGLGRDHDLHRPFVGGRGSAELVWKNLEAAVDRLQRLHILMVLNPETIAGAPAAVEQMYRMGVSRVSLLPNMEADWNETARSKASEVYHHLARVVFLSQATPEPFNLSPFSDQHEAAPRTAHCSFGVKEVAVSPAGRLYPCARLVGTDTRQDVQVGTLETGPLRERIREVTQCSHDRMEACGTGGPCACVPLMPGDLKAQIDAYKFFAALTGESVVAARQWMEEVQALARAGVEVAA